MNLLGAGLEVFSVIIFYGTFWKIKKFTYFQLAGGLALTVALDLLISSLLLDTIALPIVSTVLFFIISLFFISSVTSKALLSFVVMAIIFTFEQLVGLFVENVWGTTVENVQSDIELYLLGVLVSKLLVIFVAYITRFVMKKGNKQETDRKFNLLMAAMPVQSIILCFILYGYTANNDALRSTPIGIVAALCSLMLIFITMLILNNHRKALSYKSEYELAQSRLEMQIEHDQKVYQAQREIKSIRHEVSNKLLAISGLLTEAKVKEALSQINKINADIKRTTNIVDTGFPPVDAVLTDKISKADGSGIRIVYKVLIDGNLNIGQFDLALIVASALDNAIEGILRSDGVDRGIMLHIASVSEHISIFCENCASGPIDENFQTTKPDKSDHGFGITQMRDVAQKYSGDVLPNYDRETGKFSLKILMKNHPG